MTYHGRIVGAAAVPREKGSHPWNSTGRPASPPPATAVGWTTDGEKEVKKVDAVMEWMLLTTPHPRTRCLSLHHARQDALAALRVALHHGNETRAAEDNNECQLDSMVNNARYVEALPCCMITNEMPATIKQLHQHREP